MYKEKLTITQKSYRVVAAGLILAATYEFGNYNDSPGHFFDIQNPRHLVAAPIRNAQFVYNNFERVGDGIGMAGSSVMKVGGAALEYVT